MQAISQLDYKWRATLIVSLGLFMAVLDNTVVNVALLKIKDFYHVANYNDVVWVSTAYFLAQAAVIPAIGYISDRVGTKTIFLAALALFTFGSLMCALAPSLPALIVLRVIQGIGGGALFPIVIAITFRIFPPAERSLASAVTGIPVLLAPAFGPTIGGYLTTVFDWHAIFMVNVPIGILVFIGAALTLRDRQAEVAVQGFAPHPQKQGFDIAGLVLVMAGVTTLVYGISEAGSNGWGDHRVLGFMGLGVVLLAVFAYLELNVIKDPVLDLRLFTNYTFTVGNLLVGAVSAFFFGAVLLFPIFFQNVLNYSPLNSGEVFILQGLTAGVGVVLSGRLYNRVGPRPLALIGLILVVLGTIPLLGFNLQTTGWSIQFWMILRGLGFGLTLTTFQTYTLASVNNRAMARASSLFNVMRQIFGAIGVATITAYLSQATASQAKTIGGQVQRDLAAKPPTGAVASCITQVGKHGQAAVQACAQHYVGQHALLNGINAAFGLVVLGLTVGAVLACFMGRDANVEALKNRQAQGEIIPDAEERPAFAVAE